MADKLTNRLGELVRVATEHAGGALSDEEARAALAALRGRVERTQAAQRGATGHRRPGGHRERS